MNIKFVQVIETAQWHIKCRNRFDMHNFECIDESSNTLVGDKPGI